MYATVIDATTIIKQRVARSNRVLEVTSETTSVKEDFQPVESPGEQILLETQNEEYPSTTHVTVPKSEKGIRCNDTLASEFETGVTSVLQLFISPSQSTALKINYIQLMTFLTETTSDEDYIELGIQVLKSEVYGGHRFVIARDVLLWFMQMERHTYTDREIVLITGLQKRLNVDFRTLSMMAQLNFAQNNLWYMMRNGTNVQNELLKKKMKKLK